MLSRLKFFKHLAGLSCGFKMDSLIFLLFGILGTVRAIYKIPEYDACVLKVLLCDDFIKPLTPIDNSTLEMFENIGQLNEVCDQLSNFRMCLKKAEIFCTETSNLTVGYDLLKNRRLAFDLCVRGSAHQHVYVMVTDCVNKYSHSVIKFCTDKAVEKVGLDFDLTDIESECRFLGEMQYCHIAVITDKCGGIAGNMLEKLVIFRGERDFMCIEYEKEKLKNLEAFNSAMDSYVQQYKNIVSTIEAQETERIDGIKHFKTPQDFDQEGSSRHFQSRISPILDENFASNDDDTSRHYSTLNLEMSYCTKNQPMSSCSSDQKVSDSTKNQPLRSCSSDQKVSDSTRTQKTVQHRRNFYEQRTGKVLSDENYTCKTKASFLLIGIRPNGEHCQLGHGEADVIWATFSPLKDIHCAWMVHPTASVPLSKCSILIDNSSVHRKVCKTKLECDRSSGATMAVYEIVDKRELKRVAELKVHSFVKHSSPFERYFDNMINFFIKHAHDIRYWCSNYHEANKFEKFNRIHSTRMGYMPLEVQQYGMVNERRQISDEKYNFYMPDQSEYSLDTEIHFMSFGKGHLEKEFEVGSNYASQDHDETLNPFLSDEMLKGRNSDEPIIQHPSTSSKSSSYSYRPNKLYRPRVGETLEAENQDVLSNDQEIEDSTECYQKPNILAFENAIEYCPVRSLHAENFCPELSENISKLIKKPGSYSPINHMNMDDALDVIKPKHHEKFLFSKTEKDVASSNVIWEPEKFESNEAENEQNDKEIYVVTQSTEIETSSVPVQMLYENGNIQNLNENSQILNKKNVRQD